MRNGIVLLGLLLNTSAIAGTFAHCKTTKIIDDYIFEEALDTDSHSEITLNSTAVGYRFFIGAAQYENWEYCNIEPILNSTYPIAYRIDDYKEDLTLFLTAAPSEGSKLSGQITVKLNPAKPATLVAEIECDLISRR